METELTRDTKMHKLARMRMGLKHPLINTARIKEEDIGKVFVLDPERSSGKIMTHEERDALPPSQIGGWMDITEFEVNT